MDRCIPEKEICEADATSKKGKRKLKELYISSGPGWNNCFTLGISVLGDQILSIHVRTCFVI